MSTISDFNDTELWIVRSAVTERCGKTVERQLAESELRLDLDSPTLTVCPPVDRAECGANFVICKLAENRYRPQLFYSVREPYGTGRDHYTDLRLN